MSVKNEVAALMASEGEYEKKISLLKKAVVSVTRQKQELEAQNAQLHDDAHKLQQELSSSKEENLKLHRRVTTLENELDQERKRGTNFGQNFMKGLSSLVAGGDDGAAGGGGGANSNSPAAVTAAPTVAGGGRWREGNAAQAGRRPQLTLSPEDVENVVKENEKLHKQVYALNTAHSEAKTKTKEEVGRLKAELERMARAEADQRGLLDTTTRACDELNAECVTQRALVAFCQHYFALSAVEVGRGGEEHVVFHVGPKPGVTPLPAGPSAASTALEDGCAHLRILLDAVSMLLATLRDTLPLALRATIGELRLFTDRLATLQEAHSREKMALAHQLGEVQHWAKPTQANCGADAEDENEEGEEADGRPQGPAEVEETGSELIAAVLRWVRLMRSHVPLLVDSCVARLPVGQCYRLPHLCAGGAAGAEMELPEDAVEEREAFVEGTVGQLDAFLSALEGSLAALQLLVGAATTPSVASQLPAAATAAQQRRWLVSLLHFWWEGCQASVVLRSAAASAARLVGSVAGACHTDPVKDALLYVSARLEVFGGPAGGGEDRQRQHRPHRFRAAAAPWAVVDGPHQGSAAQWWPASLATSPLSLHTGTAAVTASAAAAVGSQDEFMHALAAADRAAVHFHTQLHAAVLELAEREDLLQQAREELQVSRAQLADSNAQAEEARAAFQEKIRMLSDQIVQRTRGATSAVAADSINAHQLTKSNGRR